MPRVPLLTKDDVSSDIARLYESVRRRYGDVLAPVAAAAHNPAVLDAYVAFERAMAQAGHLETRLKELVSLKVAALLGCPFCIDIGSALSRELGVTDDMLCDLPIYRESGAFSEREKCALAYAEAMSGSRAAVDPSLFARLEAHFDHAQIVELTAVIAWENYRSRFNKALDLEAHGFVEEDRRVRAEQVSVSPSP